jgi:hypothetical protein
VPEKTKRKEHGKQGEGSKKSMYEDRVHRIMEEMNQLKTELHQIELTASQNELEEKQASEVSLNLEKDNSVEDPKPPESVGPPSTPRTAVMTSTRCL